MELFAADGHDAGGCERVTGKSGMRPSERLIGQDGLKRLDPLADCGTGTMGPRRYPDARMLALRSGGEG